MNDCELDLATGEVIHQVTDVFLALVMPLELTRRYVSSVYADGPLGWGWTSNFAPAARVSAESLTKLDAIDGDVELRWSDCDGAAGPLVHLVNHPSEIPRWPSAGSTSDALSRLRQMMPGQLLVLTYPQGGFEAYAATSGRDQWLLSEMADGYGNFIRYEHVDAMLRRISTSDGQEVRFEYRGSHVSRIELNDLFARARLTETMFAYNGAGDLIWCRDAAGAEWEYEYSDHLLVRFRGPGNLTRVYFYDDTRRCVATEYEPGRRVRVRRDDPMRHRVVVTDTYGLQTVLDFNEAGALTRHTDALGASTSQLLDANNQLLAVIAADGSVQATMLFDPAANALVDDVDGCIWMRQVDASGRIEKITSPSGLSQTFIYDERGELRRLITWNGGTFDYGYDEHGNLARVRDPLGYEILREEIPEKRFVRILDLEGVLFEQQFDGLGNLLWERDASGREYRYGYTAVDNLASEAGPSGETSHYMYDAAQNLAKYVDALGRVWEFASDELNHLISETNPLGLRTEYEYDLEGNLVRIRNERGETYEIFRDVLYREIGTRAFDGRGLRYELDALGRRVVLINARGQRQRLSYGDGGTPIRREFHDGAVEEYSLNNEGEYVGITFKSPSDAVQRTMSFEFDPTHRLTREAGDGLFIEYEWNRAAILVGIRDSFGAETRYDLDPRYNVAVISEGGRSIELRHLPTGEISQITYPNGLAHRFTYDTSGRMSGRETVSPSGDVLTWRRYAYDAEDQLVAMEDWHWGRFAYRYDNAGRLTRVEAENDAYSESFQYDGCGNLTARTSGGRSTYSPGNRIEASENESFEFDADGNLIARHDRTGHWQYVWDRDDRLAEIWCNAERIAAYEYDLIGRRLRKTTASGTTTFLHDIYALRAEQRPDGEVRHYVTLRGLPVPIASWGDSGWQYYSYDQLGTPYEVFGESGELLATFLPRAYGDHRRRFAQGGATVHLPFGFMGQYRDEESGLFYNHFRYYDPRFARYISPDPLGVLAGLNFYRYPTNPNNEGDICGLMPTFQCLPKWTPCQKAYARAKIAAVNNAPAARRKNTCTRCRANAQRRDFKSKRCGKGKIPRGRAIDHMHELQAGGPDRCCANLRAVPKKYNGELGSQTRKMLKGIGLDKTIGPISTKGCNGGPCSKEDMNKLATPPPTTSVPCKDPPLDDNC
jgi:RHS repeat-associated protein